MDINVVQFAVIDLLQDFFHHQPEKIKIDLMYKTAFPALHVVVISALIALIAIVSWKFVLK